MLDDHLPAGGRPPGGGSPDPTRPRQVDRRRCGTDRGDSPRIDRALAAELAPYVRLLDEERQFRTRDGSPKALAEIPLIDQLIAFVVVGDLAAARAYHAEHLALLPPPA